MRLNPEWRKFAKEIVNEDGCRFFFHPGIPSQSEYVAEFLKSKGADVLALDWRQHLFYVLHGFLIDCEFKGSMLEVYVDEVNGKTLDEAYEIHMNHPLLDNRMFSSVLKSFNASRDKSLENKQLDPNSEVDEEEIEKKELA